MAFPPGFLDELRSRISLADLVGRRVRLARKGREWGGLCPFHNEKTPSFYVVEDKGFFHCFGCGAHGDAIGFVMRADNLDFIEAVEKLAGEAGIAVPQQTPQERERATRQKTQLEALAAATSFYEAQLWAPGNSAGGARAREYLARRGLDEETIRRFRLGWAPDDRQALRRALGADFPEALLHEAGLLRLPEGGGAPYDYFRGRVIFPIGDRAGRTIAFGGRTLGDDQPKYLNSPDTPLFEKGRVLYGWAHARANLARGDGSAIVVEGYMDVIALHRAGFGGAVAPLGTALTEMQLAELWRLSPEPLLCFDGDSAGQRAALRALGRALPLLQPGRSLRFVELPDGEDPDSLISSHGRQAFEALQSRAWTLADMLWESEVRGKPRKTPDQLAAIQSRLMAHVALIPDRTVRFEYETLFRQRSNPWQARRKDRDGAAPRPVVHELPPPLPASRGRRNRELFLAIFIEHPIMIEEWIEEIAALEVPEPALDSLRRAILEIGHAHPGLDAGMLRQHLALCGHAETLGTLAQTVARHAGFAARGGDDPEVIRLGLTETLQLLRARHPGDPARDPDGVSRAFASDASDDDLHRLTALMERKLQDGPVGGFE